MELERVEWKSAVRAEYTLLLRIEAEMLLPTELPRAREFYKTLCKTCTDWAREVYGHRLTEDFEALEDVAQRARIRPHCYRFRVNRSYEDGELISFVCESALVGAWRGFENGYFRTAQVWKKKEGLLMPMRQVLRYFGFRLSPKVLPFQPDGVYPEEGRLVVFRNVTERFPFTEKKLLIDHKKRKDIKENENSI